MLCIIRNCPIVKLNANLTQKRYNNFYFSSIVLIDHLALHSTHGGRCTVNIGFILLVQLV